MTGMIDAGCWPLVGASRMRALDRHTIEKLHVTGEILMESAGRAVLEALLTRLSSHLTAPGNVPVQERDGEVCIVCGAGNNAGDGFVLARHLALLGRPVRVVLLTSPERLGGDAAANFARLGGLGVVVMGADWTPPSRGVLVDAVFGTGLSREVEGEMALGIERINDHASEALKVLSIDLPSGLDSDTGQVLGVAVQADLTVTISLPKLGLALEPGRSRAGEVWVARIGIADGLPGELSAAGVESVRLWAPRGAAACLPERPRAGHKGSFGHVLVVAGSEGKTGAAALAARAACRGGAGLITVACPSGLNDILEVKCTEAMTAPLPQTTDRALSSAALGELLELARARDVVAFGPGIGDGDETVALARAVAEALEAPMVLDADGLNAFAGEPGLLKARPGETVLTPHPGEAGRLLGQSAAAINRDRIGAARALATQTSAVVLLKGAATVVAEPDGRVWVTATGGPALASGGTGDVLTGLVAAHLSQGLSPLMAAATAAYLHGAAADRLTARHGPSGLLASELADELPVAAEALRREVAGERAAGSGVSATLLPFPGP